MESKRQPARQLQVAALVVVVFVFGFALGSQYSTITAQGSITLPADVEAEFEPLYQAYNLIDDQFIDAPEANILVDGAIRGMVEALDDPYSNYVDPASFPFVDSSLSGEIEGIGVVITENEETGEIEVVNVLQGTPAEEAGLEEGDAFIEVNDEYVVGMTYLELASRVRGPAGTSVNITMRRGEDLLDFVVERARIEIPNVETDILEGDIAYISMTQFTSVAREQVDLALAELDPNSRNGLILDLRGNPGGLLTSATQIAGLFLESGTILIEEFGDGDRRIFKIRDDVVYEIFDDGRERQYATNAGYAGVEVPVVVLVDERSASASELVAGTWQDNATVTLVGATTFGKGTVQLQNSLVNGGGLRLTVARWLTPNGNWISESGVTPDILVELPESTEVAEEEDPQLDAAIGFILSEMTVTE
jgi:carboxyl-terminal processing protease